MAQKVLFIEDFMVMQQMYRDVLTKAGVEVDFVQDGTDALKVLEDKEYDVIFVDMLLPVMNGIEFLEEYMKRPPQTKIYMLSDFHEAEAINRAKELGADGYLRKTDYPPTKILELLGVKSDERPEEQPE